MNSRRSYTAKFYIVSANCRHILLVSARIARVVEIVESPSLSGNRNVHRHNMAFAQATGGLSICSDQPNNGKQLVPRWHRSAL